MMLDKFTTLTWTLRVSDCDVFHYWEFHCNLGCASLCSRAAMHKLAAASSSSILYLPYSVDSR